MTTSEDTTKLVGTLLGAYVAVKVIDAVTSKKKSTGLFGTSKKFPKFSSKKLF